mgnify:CR=1 FL=1
MRLDKWLWAARFFKTRSLAQEAIEAGRVRLEGERTKPSKEVKPGDRLAIRVLAEEWEVAVRALSDRRGPAAAARLGRSGFLLAVQADGSNVMTVEGLGIDGRLHPIQESFWEKHALQCGFCTPGQLMAIYGFLKSSKRDASEAVEAVGLYVPGGTAAYPSSVLMNAVPAKVAGVRRLVMTVPAPDGVLSPLVLAAARVAGVTRVFRIGGEAVEEMLRGEEHEGE